jgi:beta-lactamase regulating signal transducer with metallopeptidase domain
MISKYAGCTAERVLEVYDECLRKVKFRHTPPLLFGKIKEPACVIATWRSYVVLQEEIIRDLTDDELKTVLIHELLHIKRKHTVLQRIFDLVCCVHWFNPFIWIGRREFSSACEIDCDRSVLKAFDGELQAIAYAKVMVRLMELAAAKKKPLHGTLGALDFWVAKHRISNLLNKPSKLQKTFVVFACAAIICGTVWLSIDFSRSHFYPYSGISNGTEWSETE